MNFLELKDIKNAAIDINLDFSLKLLNENLLEKKDIISVSSIFGDDNEPNFII